MTDQRDREAVGRASTATLDVAYRDVSLRMMLRFARHLLVVLIAFAIVGGTTTQLAHAAQAGMPMMMGGVPCDMMMMPATDADHGKPVMPCKGMTPDCVKSMGCVADVALPAPFMNHAAVLPFTAVAYWSALNILAALTYAPEPLPPRTI